MPFFLKENQRINWCKIYEELLKTSHLNQKGIQKVSNVWSIGQHSGSKSD